MTKKKQPKPWGYWRNWENLERELKKIIGKNNGQFPSWKKLNQSGRSDITNAVKKHGGMRIVRQKLGFDESSKENGFYENWGNVMGELEKACDELGHFPSSKELRESGRSTLAVVICSNYGGFFSVREKMGYEHPRLKDNHYSDFNKVKKELNRIIKLIGHFPSQKELKSLERGSLTASIYKHHGGLVEVREKMGHENDDKDRGYWQKWENVESEINSLIKELEHFPTHSELKAKGFTSLSGAILTHGGTNKVRKKLGYSESRKSSGYWQKENNFEKELREAIKKNDEQRPTEKWLRNNGYSGLIDAAYKYYGGLPTILDRVIGKSSEDSQLESLLESYAGGN